MRFLFIAPLPPPVTGHALVSKALLDDLARYHTVDVVDLRKESFTDGLDSVKRLVEILVVLKNVWRKRKRATVIYLTISESRMGNLKDLVIYLICYRNLSKMYIHLHGGTIKRVLWDHNPTLYRINRLLIGRMRGAIVSGESHLPIFEPLLPKDRIHIVRNFAEEYLFATESEIRDKFIRTDPLRILYISNFIPKKGYKDLAAAFKGLSESAKRRVRIDFAGRFDSVSDEKAFVESIAPFEQLHYHGVVDDEQKKTLFLSAHVFCLPTTFFEGQPVSILEGYAAGCVVVTTGQSGILDVFTDGINGLEIQPSSPDSIIDVVGKLIEMPDRLPQIALTNNSIARRQYRSAAYTASLRRILESPIPEGTRTA